MPRLDASTLALHKQLIPLRIGSVCDARNSTRTQIENALACFEAQDYRDGELVVLTDSATAPPQRGERWSIVNDESDVEWAAQRWDASVTWDPSLVYMPWHLWRFLEKAPRVEILYHSVHYIDLIRSFLGEPSRVHALTVKHPDTLKLHSTRTNIALDYGQTMRANITTNHGHKFGLDAQESYVKWEGTRGAIKATLSFARSMSVDDAMDPANVLCYEMNGQPLPRENGQPLRLIAPRWYGIANVKWLERIEVIDRRFEGPYMAERYVTVREEPREGGGTALVRTSVGKSLLKSITAKVTVKDGTHRIRIEQGYEMGRPSQIDLTLTIAGGKLVAGAIGGGAVVVTEGVIEA